MKILRVVFLFFLISGVLLFPVKKGTKLILSELDQMKSAMKVLESIVVDMNTELKELKKKMQLIDNKVSAITKNLADEEQNNETILLSLQFIKEEFNEVKNGIGKINDKLTSIPFGTVGKTGESKGIESKSVVQSPDSVYFTAYSDYNKKNYDLAIEGFSQFVSQFPNNVLADNSLYWIGECYYAQKEYSKAVNTFSDIVAKYKKGDKVPDALLKKGYALIEMDRIDNGISVLKKLISDFPLSEEAYLAQQKIKELSD